ncbi:MAG TPA: 30S ribosomal protein S13 [Nitrososphaeraceae archaeon]|nr:30S ribosomal protein S13 [Nitrososphaeraceae archaeon]
MVFIEDPIFTFCLSASDFKHIVRIAGKDIAGSKKLITALSEIRGVGYNYSQVLLQSLNINPNIRVGFITDRELTDVEAAVKNPSKSGVPEWYLNRRKDIDTGSHQHLITSDLDFAISNDIDREKNVMSWRGYRHMFGLRVRGQCTRTTGRRGGAVGVKKTGKPIPAAGAGGAPSTTSAAGVGVASAPASTESAAKATTDTPKESPKK